MYRGEYYQEPGEINNSRAMYVRAVENYNKVFKFKSDDGMDYLFFYNVGWLYYNRAESYEALGDYEHAIEDYLRVVNLPANDEYDTYISLSLISLRTAYDNLAESHVKKKESAHQAVAAYTKLINFTPKDSSGYSSRGNFYMELHDYDNALKDFGQAIKLDPKDDYTYGKCAAVYVIQKNTIKRLPTTIKPLSLVATISKKNKK